MPLFDTYVDIPIGERTKADRGTLGSSLSRSSLRLSSYPVLSLLSAPYDNLLLDSSTFHASHSTFRARER